jgi:hypothetical protein
VSPTDQSDRQRWPSARWLLAALGLAAALLALVLIVPRLLYPPLPDRDLDRDAVIGKDRVQLRNDRLRLQNDARATLLQGLAGGVLLLGAYFTWRQLQLSRQELTQTLHATGEQLDATRRQLAIAQEGQLAERFSRAIEHLGSSQENLDVRLGGIFALEWIATSSPRQRRTVASILTAYVRRHAAWTAGPAQRARISGPPPTPLADLPRLEARAPDIQAALTVLGRLVSPTEDMAEVVDRLQLFDTDLRGAFLVGANLQAVLLGGAHLQGASLRDADLRGAFLVYAQLSDVSLHGTDLRGADLRCAQFEGARHLNHADLRGAVVDTKARWPAGFDPSRPASSWEPTTTDGQPLPRSL